MDVNQIITEQLYPVRGGFNYTNYQNKHHLDVRIPDSYTKAFKDIVKLLGIGDIKPQAYGTFNLKAQRYPSDIDLINEVYFCCNKETAIKIMAVKIKEVIENIDEKKYFLGDVKVGLDMRYNFNFGYWKKGKLFDWDYKIIKKELEELYQNKLLDNKHLIGLVKANISHENWDKLSEELRRDYLIIRWSRNELLNGHKILRGNVKISLEDALSHKTMIKIDIWTYFFGRFIEATNFYALGYVNKNEKHLINLDDSFFEQLDDSLRKEVEKLLFSRQYFNPLKSVKRLFVLAKHNEDKSYLNQLDEIIVASVAFVNQVKSDIEVLINMFKRIPAKKLPYNNMIEEIDNFKNRLAIIIEFPINEKLIDQYIDDIVFNAGILDTNHIIAILEEIKNILKPEINKYAIFLMRYFGIFPIPKKYLPPKGKRAYPNKIPKNILSE